MRKDDGDGYVDEGDGIDSSLREFDWDLKEL